MLQIASPSLVARPPIVKLNEHFEKAPSDLATSEKRSATLWKVAKIVSIVASLALSVLACIAAAAWTPEYFMLLAFTTLIGLQGFTQLTNYFDGKIDHHTALEKKYRRVETILPTLPKDEASLEYLFGQYGLRKTTIEAFDKIPGGFKTLATGLAHVNELEQSTRECMIQRNTCIEKAQRAKGEEQEALSQTALLLHRIALMMRIQSAYLYAVLKKPFRQIRKLSELGESVSKDPSLSVGLQFCKIDEPVFLFKDKKIPAITQKEAALSIERLSQGQTTWQNDPLNIRFSTLLR